MEQVNTRTITDLIEIQLQLPYLPEHLAVHLLQDQLKSVNDQVLFSHLFIALEAFQT